MTFCIGIKTSSGVVALADTRISSGLGVSTSKKIKSYTQGKHSFFIMSSGLRSIRDKVINYFDDDIETNECNKLYKAVNLLGSAIKRARSEDLEDLKKSNFIFDAHFIVGGQCEDDKEGTIFLIFPEGNWVEVSEESPYALIGNTAFGKPILRRILGDDTKFDTAIKAAYLSFESTYKNASDVDYPVDFAIYRNGSFSLQEVRKTEEELKATADAWNQMLSDAASKLPLFIHIDENFNAPY